MSKKEYYILAVALFTAITIYGYITGGFKGSIISFCLGVIGFVIGRLLNAKN